MLARAVLSAIVLPAATVKPVTLSRVMPLCTFLLFRLVVLPVPLMANVSPFTPAALRLAPAKAVLPL